jgi:hypothetical protein
MFRVSELGVSLAPKRNDSCSVEEVGPAMVLAWCSPNSSGVKSLGLEVALDGDRAEVGTNPRVLFASAHRAVAGKDLDPSIQELGVPKCSST